MKRLFFITSIIVLSCVVASSVIIPITSETGSQGKGVYTEAKDTEYIIKAEGDRIVVYKRNSDKPYIETTTAVSSLPKNVQRRLEGGISYDSEKTMKAALDELCS